MPSSQSHYRGSIWVPQRWGVLYLALLLVLPGLADVADGQGWPHQVAQVCMTVATVATLPVGLLVYAVAFFVALYTGWGIFPTVTGYVLMLVAFVVAAYGNLVFFRLIARARAASTADQSEAASHGLGGEP